MLSVVWKLPQMVLEYICKLRLLEMRFFGALLLLFTLHEVTAQRISAESFHRVNSPYDELNPVLSSDGNTLYYTVANHPDNAAGKRDPGDIWYTQWVGDQWSAPVHAGKDLNDAGYNAVCGISADGNELVLLSHYDHSGSMARTQGISVSTRTQSGWSRPHNIQIPYFQNKGSKLSGAMAADNSAFIFSAETYGSKGVEDLYVSIRENGKWTEARNLGDVINTQFQELSPSLSEDGKTLYFSSNGRNGAGSFDVYSSTRLDDSWTTWSQPVNMGGNINTEGRELYYRDYPQWGFSLFTSTTNSDGYGDMKVHRYDDPPIARKDTTPVIASLHASADTAAIQVAEPIRREDVMPANVVRISGKVTNSKSGEPVEATIRIAGPALLSENITTANERGFVAEVPAHSSYTVKIEAPGYISVLEKLDILTYETNQLEMNFSLQPVEVGTTVNLRNVLFAQSKAELLPDSYDELDLVVSFLQTNPNVKIDLSGHTDNRGVHSDNIRLSQQRVNTVKAYLVSRGIETKRITGKGFGGTKPIASNDTEETRRMNRRVEFTIRKK